MFGRHLLAAAWRYANDRNVFLLFLIAVQVQTKIGSARAHNGRFSRTRIRVRHDLNSGPRAK